MKRRVSKVMLTISMVTPKCGSAIEVKERSMGAGESRDFVRSAWYDLDWRGNVGIVGHGNFSCFGMPNKKDWRPITEPSLNDSFQSKTPPPTGESQPSSACVVMLSPMKHDPLFIAWRPSDSSPQRAAA